MALHINIEELLSARTVESDRIEYKEGWNPNAIYRSICAFANDFENLGGGYILIGVEEDADLGIAKRPVKGLKTSELASIQKDMIGFNNLVKPHYAPKLSIEQVDGKQILILWVVAGSERPYEVPETITSKHKSWTYYIRRYASSIEAKGEDKEELIALSNNIPFDDRSNTQAGLDDISIMLLKGYLIKVKSRLASQVGKLSDREILAQMELVSGPSEHIFPRNVGLMLFSENPEKFFPATRVEIVYFPNGEAAEFTEYPVITGPVPDQIKRTLDFLKTNFLKEKVIKQTDQAESIRIWNYPLQAIEETLVNAFYHRDYQQREPIEIRIYPESLVFLNHGGPDRSIQISSFQTGKIRSRRYRNRRLGEFLKELGLTEGRATGIPTILKTLKDNGSPQPHFQTDDSRTYFEVEIAMHTAFAKRPILKLDLQSLKWDLQGIDALMEKVLEGNDMAAFDIADDIAGDGNSVDNQIDSVFGDIADDIADDIAVGIESGVLPKQIEVLRLCMIANSRVELFQQLNLARHPDNFRSYIQPLLGLGWLSMTIPDKPTSPIQRYVTTLKGRMILQFLKGKK